MSDFRRLNENVMVSPQLALEDIPAAAALGVATIVNNRPDGEEPSAPQGEDIAAAAAAAGLNYVAIPIGHSGFSEPQVDAMIAAMEQAEGPILAYCRSGTRSTLLWALASAKQGENPDTIARTAAQAGYDVSPIRSLIDMLSQR
ncbi:TIGR01244 family sulfur transferase [Erythrobacter sp. BLCC-B19]|uniref:TIGR01244 family sulfur transferase n=1 Tax=Erythrobacter sp. BLCC-B19 TaxID=3025315 RepID=UPI00236067EF|nr:TIGR01244 family sulfur transferase [Erythrobacter sp. BLCC-B19]WDA42835.1 TIGR01244 family sulfur transferase [Erythrobacter sp. BLCC-B19]